MSSIRDPASAKPFPAIAAIDGRRRLIVRCIRAFGFAAVLIPMCAPAERSPAWTVLRSAHFEIYSQTGGESGRAALVWFEQLQSFFAQFGLGATGVKLADRPPVRVIGFSSASDYDSYRLRPSADAYYVGAENRDYIVMPRLGPEEFRIAAHEYAHAVFRAAGLRLPPWMNEGWAEFFSTVHIGNRGCELGAILPQHLQTLRTRKWISLSDLTDSQPATPFRDRPDSDLFYSESWALIHMLLLSDKYAPRFQQLLSTVAAEPANSRTLPAVFGKSLEEITQDLHSWTLKQSFPAVSLPGVSGYAVTSEPRELPGFESSLLIAELLTVTGQLDRAEAIYSDIALKSQGNPDISAALSGIALRRGDTVAARQQLRRAIEQGSRDAALCYRYAELAEDAGLPASEIRSALTRAVELKPDFDDARYKLALLESNAGEYQSAVENLRAMQAIPPGRAFSYWIEMTDALTELGRREEAKQAAQEALKHASSENERAQARQLGYIAETDLTVQFARGADGQLQLVTARKAHGDSDWNPFIEPDDRVRRIQGKLRSVECGGGKITGFSIATADGLLSLSIPDPQHVLIRGGPSEFMCGPQKPAAIRAEYAASEPRGGKTDGVLRGIDFR